GVGMQLAHLLLEGGVGMTRLHLLAHLLLEGGVGMTRLHLLAHLLLEGGVGMTRLHLLAKDGSLALFFQQPELFLQFLDGLGHNPSLGCGCFWSFGPLACSGFISLS